MLLNGGFEEADETGNSLGWKTKGGGIVQRCALNGHPLSKESVPRSGIGMACFDRSHKSSPHNYVYQDIDVSAYVSAIDNGNAQVTATGYLKSDQYPSSHDVYLQVWFLDSQKGEVPNTRYDSGAQRPDTWSLYGVKDYLVPENTRYIQIRFNIWENGTGSGSADDFSVKIKGTNKHFRLHSNVNNIALHTTSFLRQ